MNRKAHVGTIMLVIGAFLLVIFALYVMLSSNTDLSLIKAELRASSDFAEASHKFVLKGFGDIVDKSIFDSKSSSEFEKSFNISLRKYASEKRESGLSNNLYAKLSLGDYSLTLKDGNYELIVLGVSEKYNLDNNEVTYAYSLKAIFDKTKVNSVKVIE
ncbi:MAG: hypothetical protein FJZ43_03705 [Candidatus Staskawiczbacteria bacterium]|nr:hypothetical protein [Candidatus Staskawiczbacteria bacterium]